MGLTLEQTAQRLGVCKGRVLREFVRTGLLPYPDAGDGGWREETVQAVVLEREQGRAAAGMVGCPACGSRELAAPSHSDPEWGCWDCGNTWPIERSVPTAS